jgi:hypothetical protein
MQTTGAIRMHPCRCINKFWGGEGNMENLCTFHSVHREPQTTLLKIKMKGWWQEKSPKRGAEAA